MSIVTIAATDTLRESRETINDNFAELEAGKLGGGAALTTVGAVPYVASAGVLAEDLLRWDSAQNRLGIGTASWDSGDQKFKVTGTGSVAVGVNAATGNNSAELTLWSGGGASSGDHAVVGFKAGSTIRWYLGGVWNGVSDFVLVAADAGFVYRMVVYNSTGNAAFGSSVGADNGYRVSAHQAGTNGFFKGGNFTVNASGQVGQALTTPASAAATGVAGTIVWDADYIYICVATNTWKRVAIATW